MTGAPSGCNLGKVTYHKIPVALVQTGGGPKRALGQMMDSCTTAAPADTLWLWALEAGKSHCLNFTVPQSVHPHSRGDPRLLLPLWAFSTTFPLQEDSIFTQYTPMSSFKFSKGKGSPAHPMRAPFPQPRSPSAPRVFVIRGTHPSLLQNWSLLLPASPSLCPGSFLLM